MKPGESARAGVRRSRQLKLNVMLPLLGYLADLRNSKSRQAGNGGAPPPMESLQATAEVVRLMPWALRHAATLIIPAHPAPPADLRPFRAPQGHPFMADFIAILSSFWRFIQIGERIHAASAQAAVSRSAPAYPTLLPGRPIRQATPAPGGRAVGRHRQNHHSASAELGRRLVQAASGGKHQLFDRVEP